MGWALHPPHWSRALTKTLLSRAPFVGGKPSTRTQEPSPGMTLHAMHRPGPSFKVFSTKYKKKVENTRVLRGANCSVARFPPMGTLRHAPPLLSASRDPVWQTICGHIQSSPHRMRGHGLSKRRGTQRKVIPSAATQSPWPGPVLKHSRHVPESQRGPGKRMPDQICCTVAVRWQEGNRMPLAPTPTPPPPHGLAPPLTYLVRSPRAAVYS